MTVKLANHDANDPINRTAAVHRTSPSSGQAESAVFNIHSFNLGDVSRVAPDTFLEFKAYRLVKTETGLGQELVGSYQLAVA